MTRTMFVALLLASAATAAPVPKVVLSAEQEKEFNELWDARNEGTPNTLRLYCRLVSQPDAGAEYLRRLVKPSELSLKEAKQLIADLGSNDESTWKRAYRDLIHRDVRLAMTLSEAWDEAKTDVQRGRLAHSLVGHYMRAPSGELLATLTESSRPDEGWELRVTKNGYGRTLYRVVQTFDEQAKLEKGWDEQSTPSVPLVIAALERINTSAARNHLQTLANGHEDARFTRQATAALARLKTGKDVPSTSTEEVWRRRLESVSRVSTANEFLNHPEQAVKVFRANLRPVKLTKHGAKELLANLLGDDKKAVRAALSELQVVDLQLEMDFAEMWGQADTPAQRCRLVDAMKIHRTYPYNAIPADFDLDERNALRDYTLTPTHRVGESPIDMCLSGIWRADVPPASRQGDRPPGGESFGFLSKKGEMDDGRWYREMSAIYILDAIGTDDAIAIIKDMATGHPDAGPTKAAKEVLKRRGVK